MFVSNIDVVQYVFNEQTQEDIANSTNSLSFHLVVVSEKVLVQYLVN